MKIILYSKMKNSVIKGFKAVDFMREVRDKISMDTKDMNFEEVKKHMEERRKNTPLYSDAFHTFETAVVSEPVKASYITTNENPLIQQPIESNSVNESAKFESGTLSEKYAGKINPKTADSLQHHVKR